jgi:hypothetical protein
MLRGGDIDKCYSWREALCYAVFIKLEDLGNEGRAGVADVYCFQLASRAGPESSPIRSFAHQAHIMEIDEWGSANV